MNTQQKQKLQKQIRRENVLENLKDIGSGAGKSLRDDLLKEAPGEFFNQLIGAPRPEKKYSGDITPGETLEVAEVFSQTYQEKQILSKQIALERKLQEEERILIERKGNELRVELQAIMQEVAALAKTTQAIGNEVEIAIMQAPISPGVYHVIFFEKLLEYLKNFRKNIQNAVTWLTAANSRAQKKNFWGNYKKHGGKFLLSPDHYLQRSAG
jgi:hypothetical protein